LIEKNQQNILLEELVPKFIRETKKKMRKERKKHERFQNSNEKEDIPTIRIMDLPRNASFDDVCKLVNSFNSKRIKLPRDTKNLEQKNRGYAFISFENHKQAELNYIFRQLNLIFTFKYKKLKNIATFSV